MTATRDGDRATTTRPTVQTTNLHPHSTPPVHVSLSLKRLLVDQFTPDTLRTLAWLKEHDSPGMVARRDLSNASIEELADILTAGRKPTIGWWSRHMDVAS